MGLTTKGAFAARLAFLTERIRREILRLRVPTGNREDTLSGIGKNRDATLRMTPAGVGWDFGASFSANIRHVIRLVINNQHVFTKEFIRMKCLSAGLRISFE